MPIYEYQCQTCGAVVEVLQKHSALAPPCACRHCQGEQFGRLISRVAIHKTEAQRLQDFDPRKSVDDAFYKDDRNIGLWAQKKMKALGADQSESFGATLERARSGQLAPDL